MIRNIFYKILLILILSSILMFICTLFIIQYNNIKYSQLMIVNIIEMLEKDIYIYNIQTEYDLKKFVIKSDEKKLRISIINTNGVVIADTITDTSKNFMDNHINRSDIIGALHNTNNKPYFYIGTSINKKIQYIYASK